ncbi:hypothetical protein pdam_00021646, partial [Pocillopora damicornis]
MELVDHVFSPLIQQGVNKGDILDMMEQFGLIAKYSPSPADVQYFVPCQLRSSPEELCKMEPSCTDPCLLYLHFQEGFVPHGLFTRLVSKSVAWCGANGSSQPPKLYQNGAWFVLEGRVIHDMILICKKKFIKILLRQRVNEAVLVSNSTLAEVARNVRLFMERILEKMSQEFPYLSRMQYEFCVECPYCQQGGRKCTDHNQLSCAKEDCLHLLELRQGQALICMESINPQAGQEEDNDGASADGIHALRARILEVLRKEPYMGEKIPVRWFNFEKVIEALVADNVYHTNTVHLQTYAKDVCFIEDDGQFHTMLNFYHDLGMIVKHRSTVILKAQWLIDLFKKLITIPAFKKADPVHSKYWLELERSGVLKMELVDHVFSPLIQQGVNKGDILDMMEQFGLIAKYSPSLADVQYFVPCQLRSSPEELCKVEPSSTDPCPLYLHFLEGFVPHGLFTRLVSKSVAWCGASGLSQPPKLYQNGAWFVLEGRKFIKILLRQRIKTGALPVSNSTLAEVARSVRLFIESILEKMSREFPYLSRMQHEFCVECPYCQQGGRKCTNHNQLSCTEEECIHLLELRQGQDLICMESMSNEVLTVPGQERWLLNQDLAPSVRRTSQVVPLRGHPAECDKTLKVALLASEWNSSMGGLSTINRHLAILMAKRNEVEVTLLVPQFACSEEEKRDAESHKIIIKEAERRPGFDALDWLSFPPKDLVIDVVLGHGAKLGRQAQIIRESHSCQWVQVVHTAPEELGMFKNYPRAIARGEEKTTAEVDLCKLANLVVAVGPKLTEAYSAYLQSCERQQDIMSLTPGTFKEFSTLNHASIDSEKFRVLTFGRGDPEDFGLKGYDIAAKAVAELKDNSYHLIFNARALVVYDITQRRSFEKAKELVDEFAQRARPANIHLKSVLLDHDMIVTLVMWDISGSVFFFEKVKALVVYDITQRCSFEKAKELVDEFAQRAGPGAFVALVGNKADLESRREVSFKEAQDYADGNNMVEILMEVSALTGENVALFRIWRDKADRELSCAKRLAGTQPVVKQKLALRRKTLNLSERNLNSVEMEFLMRILIWRPLLLAQIQLLYLSCNNLLYLHLYLYLFSLTCLKVNDNRLSFLPKSIQCNVAF